MLNSNFIVNMTDGTRLNAIKTIDVMSAITYDH